MINDNHIKSEPDGYGADEIQHEHLTKYSYKGLLKKLKEDFRNDFLVFFRHTIHHGEMDEYDLAFQTVASRLQTHTQAEFATYDLDKNSAYGLHIDEGPLLRLYKAGKVDSALTLENEHVNHAYKDFDFKRQHLSKDKFISTVVSFVIDNGTEYIDVDDEDQIADM